MTLDEALARLAEVVGYDGTGGAARALEVVERALDRSTVTPPAFTPAWLAARRAARPAADEQS